VNGSVKINNEMVADSRPTAFDVPRVNGRDVNVTAFGRRGAMQNDSGEFTHGHVFNIKSCTFYTLCPFDLTL
jgi:hypothetical protein